MQPLQRHEVVGHKLVGIYTRRWHEEDNSLDFCDAVFSLENGIFFCLPACIDFPLERAEVPAKAVMIPKDSIVSNVYGIPVAALLRPRDDDDVIPGSSVLLLCNGMRIFHQICAPHGTGGAGVFVEREPDTSSSLIDFWSA